MFCSFPSLGGGTEETAGGDHDGRRRGQVEEAPLLPLLRCLKLSNCLSPHPTRPFLCFRVVLIPLLALPVDSLAQGRKKRGSGRRGGTRRRAGGAAETAEAATTRRRSGGGRRRAATGAKTKVGFLLPLGPAFPTVISD